MRQVLLGKANVGKSSLVIRFVTGKFMDHMESTIGGTDEQPYNSPPTHACCRTPMHRTDWVTRTEHRPSVKLNHLRLDNLTAWFLAMYIACSSFGHCKFHYLDILFAVMLSLLLASFFTKTFKVDDEDVTFEIWDTAGQGWCWHRTYCILRVLFPSLVALACPTHLTPTFPVYFRKLMIVEHNRTVSQFSTHVLPRREGGHRCLRRHRCGSYGIYTRHSAFFCMSRVRCYHLLPSLRLASGWGQ